MSNLTPWVLGDITRERDAQDLKWGPQYHPDGTSETYKYEADIARDVCDAAHRTGAGTWKYILDEEFWEAMSETDPVALRKELIQVAAVCVAWVEDIDSREKE